MTKVSLVGAYGYWNYGDDLLAWIFANKIKEWIPNVSLVVSSPYSGEDYIREMTGAEYAVPLTSIKYWLKDGKKDYKKSDLTIFGGGGILYDYPKESKLGKFDPRRSSSLFYLTSLLSTSEKGSIVAHGIGIGPLQSKYAEMLTGIFIRKNKSLTVRDDKSAILAQKFGSQVNIVPDPSFILANSTLMPRRETNKIGVVFRRWDYHPIFNNEEKIDLLFKKIKEKTGCEVVPISLRTNEFSEIAGKKVLEWDPRIMGPVEFAETLAGFSVLLTMRLHAMNVAACYGVPSVSIGIDPKIIHSARSLGLGDYVCSPDSSIDEIVNKIVLLRGEDKINYRLIETTLGYSKEVEKSFNRLKDEVGKVV
jgi:polysaccharide pyruvyl transferase WcaK-like protein